MVAIHNRFVISVSVVIVLFLSTRSFAQNNNADLKGDFKISEMEAVEQQETQGYKYDPYETEKRLIFQQLEVITGDEATRYIIVPGDTLTISYMDKERRVGSLYKVSGEGEIFLPLIGAVKVVGLNSKQALVLFNEKFSEYFRKPQVALGINISGRIMVLGEVGRPGLYLMQPNLTVMEAILKAESYDQQTANLRSVILMRGGMDKPEVMRLNLFKMITKGDRTDDIFIKPGDLIYVPKTWIANLTKFKDDIYEWVSLYYSYGRLPASPEVTENQPVLYK